MILKETSRLYDFGRRGLYRPHSKEQCEHTEPEAQPKEEHFTCCIANRAYKTLKPPQPYHSRSTLHAPVTSISHALYLSSAVLFPCPEPSSLHESSHIKALLSSTCTDETPSRSGRLTPHSRTLNTFHFITAPPGEREREKKKNESRGTAVLKGHLIYSSVALMYLITRRRCGHLQFSFREMRLGREMMVRSASKFKRSWLFFLIQAAHSSVFSTQMLGFIEVLILS